MRQTGLMWWIDRWRKSTAYTDMTLEEQGAYRNLLDEATLRGGTIPNDEKILAKSCGDVTAWERVKKQVLLRFVLGKNGWKNRTLLEVLTESRRRAVKQKAYRERKLGAKGGVGNAHGNDPPNDPHNKHGYPDPDPDRTSNTENLRTRGADRVPARVAVQGRGAGAGSYPRDHLRCLQPCGRVCFPDQLFAEFVRAHGGSREKAEAAVRAFHSAIDAIWGPSGPQFSTPIGDDKYAFWRARWREQFGSTATKSTTDDPLYRDARTPDEMAAAVRELLTTEAKGRS